jgi:putative copper resistance protein D
MAAALVGARFLHEFSLLVVFGIACFPLYAAPGLIEARPAFARWRQKRLALALALAIAGGLGWLALTAADMSGDPADALSPAAVASVVTDTDFGKLWSVRLIGCLILTMAIWKREARLVAPALAGLVLASLAGTGHAGSPDGWLGGLHHAADAAHLAAAGLWIGALWALGWMVACLGHAPETEAALRRFSGVGQLAVAVLLVTGGVNAYAILGDPTRLLTTRYGQLLDLKLMAFLGMLALAGLNRFVLTPRLSAGGSGDTLARLKWQILGEQALSLLVVGVVAVIGTLDPNA